MKKHIAIIDKAPSRTNYKEYFDFPFDLYHLSSVPVPSGTRFVKKLIDLDFDPDLYDLIILVGSEAAKEYAKVTSVTNYQGALLEEKYCCLANPATLLFKPEGKPDFEAAVKKIVKYAKGEGVYIKDGDFFGINDYNEAKEFLLEVLHAEVSFVVMDTEDTALAPRDGYVLGVSISYKRNHGRYILTDILDDALFEILQKILDKYEVVFHNAKYDVKMLEYHTPLRFDRTRVHDTMVMHYILDENDLHGLKHLALKYTNYGDYDLELDRFKKEYCRKNGILEENFTYDLIPYDIISVYASIDTAVALELFDRFNPIIQDKFRSVYNMLMQGTFFLMDMEEVGIPINKDKLAAAGTYLSTLVDNAKAELYSLEEVKRLEKDQGEIFNPASVIQLRKLLFDYIGLTPTGKLTATGAISTDAEVLEELSEQHEVPAAILKVRKLSKILNTYVLKILPELDRDSRIRTNFNLVFTTSGRLSSSGKFNAQQIVRDDPIIKGCIEAPPGYKIVSQD